MKIFALEFTNHCNAKCDYCPHGQGIHTRKKGFMTEETFERVLELVENDIGINGLGEPLLHQKCIEWIKRLSDKGIRVMLSTNGKLLNAQTLNRLKRAGVWKVVVNYGFFGKPNISEDDIVIYAKPGNEKELDDWGGRVGKSQRGKVECSFITDNWVQVLWDGKIIRCCQDFNNEYGLGNIFDGYKNKREIALCKECKGYLFNTALIVGNYDGKGEGLL